MPGPDGPNQPTRGKDSRGSDASPTSTFADSGNTIRVSLPTPGPSFRGALKSHDFFLLWVGQFGSEVGNGLVQLALPVLIYQRTDSAFQLAGAYIVQFLPWLFFGLIGGVLVDRWDRRVTIVAVEVVRAAAFLAVGVVFALDGSLISVEFIYGLIFLESTLQNLFNPARLALMPNLVKAADLRAANSLIEVSRQVGFLIAPTAGVLISQAFGASTIIIADGVTFLISGVTVLLIRWRPPPRAAREAEKLQQGLAQVFAEMQQGLSVIGRTKLLQVTLLLGISLNLVVAPLQALLPIFVREVKGFEEQGYFGALVAGFVPGLLLGSLIAPAASRRTGLGRLAIGSVIALGVVICFASFLPTLVLPVVAMFLAGTAIGALNVAQINMLQTSTTEDNRGRVGAAYYTGTLGVRSLGYLAVGALVAPIGVQALFVMFGVIVLAVGVYISRSEEVRTHR
jgi:MFS family permease